MDPNEIRDIMEMSSKLESSFRHIRYLCGRYLETEKGGSHYNQPYGEFSMSQPIGYPPYFGHESFYPPFSNGYPPQMQPPFVKLTNTAKYPPKLKPSQPLIKSSQRNSPIIELLDKQNPSQKGTQSISIDSKQQQPKPSQRPSDSISLTPIPQSGFEVFLNKKRDQIKKQYPQLEDNELFDIMTEVWKSFTQPEKDPYEAEYKKLKRADKKDENSKGGNKAMTMNEIAKSLKNDLVK